MTEEEFKSAIVKQYVDMGLSPEASSRLVNSSVDPSYHSLEVTKETSKDTKKSFENLQVSKFSFEQPVKDKSTKEEKIMATAINRAKKEDILNALVGFLGDLNSLIDASSIQEGKAGALMFKNHNGDYFTLKLTLNKTKPADFVE